MSDPQYDDVLEFVRRNDSPFVTSGDVAEQFSSVSNRTIRKRLNDLVEFGELQVREIGNGAKVWYVENQSESKSNLSPSSVSQ